MDILLWRHAEAEDGADDLERPLTQKGHDQAQTVATWLRRCAPPNLVVLSSPAVRARQTVEALTKSFIVLDVLGPGGGDAARVLGELVAISRRIGDSPSSYLVVGHQPILGRTAARLMTGQEYDWSIKKGAIWWIEATALDTGDAKLIAAMTSKLIVGSPRE